jgi:hypothetical protein
VPILIDAVLDVAQEMTDLGRTELEALLDSAALTTNKI